MKLSILIPAYNCEAYIGNCLESLLNQDFPSSEYEILVINDGSTDFTKKVLEDYSIKHSNVFFFNQKNMGVFKTTNNLLKLAKGEYIFNLDADDYITKNSLKILFDIAYENNLDFLGFDSFTTSNTGLIDPQKPYQKNDIEVTTGLEFISTNNDLKITIWWFFVKKEFITINNFLFEEGNPLADGPFTFKILLKAQRVSYVKYDIHRHLVVPTSITHNINYEHLKKMINYYVDVIYRYDRLSNNLSNTVPQNVISTKINIQDVKMKILHWRDVNLYVMFYTFIKSNVTINEINKVLKELYDDGIYPIKYFIGSRHNSFKHRFLNKLFNSKYIFFALLYPFRILHRIRIIKFS